MIRKTAALATAALLLMAAAPAPKAPAAKPAAKPPAAKAVAKPAASKPAAFDARDPVSLQALLETLGATAQLGERTEDGVYMRVASPAGNFQALFAGCDKQGMNCAALQFDAAAGERSPTLAAINAFNQSSLACRITQDQADKPHMLYSGLLSASQSREDLAMHIAAWRGCLADFGGFLKDPVGYLAIAP